MLLDAAQLDLALALDRPQVCFICVCSGVQDEEEQLLGHALLMIDPWYTKPKSNYTSTFVASFHFQTLGLAKASHMAKPKVIESGKYILFYRKKKVIKYWLNTTLNYDNK
jgi:hypothetical protein